MTMPKDTNFTLKKQAPWHFFERVGGMPCASWCVQELQQDRGGLAVLFELSIVQAVKALHVLQLDKGAMEKLPNGEEEPQKSIALRFNTAEQKAAFGGQRPFHADDGLVGHLQDGIQLPASV